VILLTNIAKRDKGDDVSPRPDTSSDVVEVVNRLVEATGAFVLSVRVERHNHDTLKVFIDSESGLTSRTINSLTRAIRNTVVENNLLSEDLHIMVSSAGADKPLVDPRQYKKNVGRELEIVLNDDQLLSGLLESADESGCTIQIGSEQQKYFTFNEIAKATVKLPW